MQIHLDLIGGLAGDMFIAALLDAFPQHELLVHAAIGALGADCPVTCALTLNRDAVLQGRRFDVRLVSADTLANPSGQPRVPFAPASVVHNHVTWRSIRALLVESAGAGDGLTSGACAHALAIFQLLADAEASVHGVASDCVEFHEVGAWDSIADIVGAATLIDAIGATRWSASPAPLGSGRVKTAHGMLPVPAPATAQLLIGMPTLDDGIAGERVTPTGAAILRYLCPPVDSTPSPSVRKLVASGTGFGRRTLPGLSNHVRVLCFETYESTLLHREISVLEFEVDDQSGEDLAAGLDRIRAQSNVLDVTQAPVFGKKGRMMVHVCVLVRAAHADAAIEACFKETTTIGLRQRSVQGIGLKRRIEEVELDGQRLRVKLVDRPGGTTAKTESDDSRAHIGHARRVSLRQRAERAALDLASAELDA